GGGCGGNKHPFMHVASSAPAIATFAYDGDTISVTTGSAGTAELQLVDDDGAMVDSIDVIVESVAELGPSHKSARVFVGGTYDLPITMYGAMGQELGGERGMLQATASGSISVTTEEAFNATTLKVAADALGDG